MDAESEFLRRLHEYEVERDNITNCTRPAGVITSLSSNHSDGHLSASVNGDGNDVTLTSSVTSPHFRPPRPSVGDASDTPESEMILNLLLRAELLNHSLWNRILLYQKGLC